MVKKLVHEQIDRYQVSFCFVRDINLNGDAASCCYQIHIVLQPLCATTLANIKFKSNVYDCLE